MIVANNHLKNLPELALKQIVVAKRMFRNFLRNQRRVNYAYSKNQEDRTLQRLAGTLSILFGELTMRSATISTNTKRNIPKGLFTRYEENGTDGPLFTS